MTRWFAAVVALVVVAVAAVPAQAGDHLLSVDLGPHRLGLDLDGVPHPDVVAEEERVTCKGSTSKPYEIEQLKPGRV